MNQTPLLIQLANFHEKLRFVPEKSSQLRPYIDDLRKDYKFLHETVAETINEYFQMYETLMELHEAFESHKKQTSQMEQLHEEQINELQKRYLL